MFSTGDTHPVGLRTVFYLVLWSPYPQPAHNLQSTFWSTILLSFTCLKTLQVSLYP
jgi:hypothetical protein